MKPADLEPLKRQAQHNGSAGWSWVFAHPAQVDELIEGYRDAWKKLGAVNALAQQALVALADHHLQSEHDPCVHGLLEEIQELSKCV